MQKVYTNFKNRLKAPMVVERHYGITFVKVGGGVDLERAQGNSLG